MIEVVLIVAGDGTLRGLRSSGHATGGDERMIAACAAVSSAVRSLGRLLIARPDLKLDGSVMREGEVEYDWVLPLEAGPETREWLRGVGDLLSRALWDVAQDYPDLIRLQRRTQED